MSGLAPLPLQHVRVTGAHGVQQTERGQGAGGWGLVGQQLQASEWQRRGGRKSRVLELEIAAESGLEEVLQPLQRHDAGAERSISTISQNREHLWELMRSCAAPDKLEKQSRQTASPGGEWAALLSDDRPAGTHIDFGLRTSVASAVLHHSRLHSPLKLLQAPAIKRRPAVFWRCWVLGFWRCCRPPFLRAHAWIVAGRPGGPGCGCAGHLWYSTGAFAVVQARWPSDPPTHPPPPPRPPKVYGACTLAHTAWWGGAWAALLMGRNPGASADCTTDHRGAGRLGNKQAR